MYIISFNFKRLVWLISNLHLKIVTASFKVVVSFSSFGEKMILHFSSPLKSDVFMQRFYLNKNLLTIAQKLRSIQRLTMAPDVN